MKLFKTLPKHLTRLTAFTLIELLVVISIIAILASLALPAIAGALVKGQITQTVNNYRQIQLLTQTASLDNQTAGGAGAFPGDVAGGVAAWASMLVPAYCSANTLNAMVSVKGSSNNTLIWLVKSTEDPSTIFVATKGIGGGTTNLTMDASGPYGSKGAAFVTLGGQAVSVTGSNSPVLTNGSAMVSTNTGSAL